MSLRFMDLFCGGGLFAEGMSEAGHKPILGIDNWKVACESFEANHCETICEDILKIDPSTLPKVDLIIGSPPCQDFSTNNLKRKENPVLIYKFLEIVEYIKPKFWIMEEVPLTRKYLPKSIPYYLLKASDFGANQRRKRLLKRAKNRCEFCHARNHRPHPITRSKVVLTIAHLNHIPEDCRDENLRALCQKCHNSYDAKHRYLTRKLHGTHQITDFVKK